MLSMMMTAGAVLAAEKAPFTYRDNGVIRIGVDQMLRRGDRRP